MRFNIWSEVCDCTCHSNSNVKHIMACCMPCEYCHKRIANHYYDRHGDSCSFKPIHILVQAYEENPDGDEKYFTDVLKEKCPNLKEQDIESALKLIRPVLKLKAMQEKE